jgi:hypothetical protein
MKNLRQMLDIMINFEKNAINKELLKESELITPGNKLSLN